MASKPQLTKDEIDRLRPLLKERIPVGDGPGCFLCKWIHEDLETNGNLTGERDFPEAGKYQHLKLEGMILGAPAHASVER
jgi:hypothetical protein